MKIIYVYDALCGWCYGFSSIMEKIFQYYCQEHEFTVISGGMIRGERVGELGKVAPYIQSAYKKVEETTGVRFGEKFIQGALAEGTMIMTSEPAAIAMAIVRKVQPQNVIPYAGMLLRAVYHDGVNVADICEFAPYAERVGVENAYFLQEIFKPEYEDIVRQEYDYLAAIGVSGFPTLLAQKGDKLYGLARGYSTFQEIQERIEALR
jgi:putative protein-disulfide isomerase